LRTLLVANRGEIARRVFRTARAMGLRCVAVYVDADRNSPFVAEADLAVELTVGSYLDGAAVIDAARRAGADAVHPGYGFLSENADFARAVTEAGLIWVGPSPEVIEAMGDKVRAKRLAVGAGVPVLPSSEEPTTEAATGIGFPVLVKAAAGGGGKGMRVVAGEAEFDEAVAAARREALGGFGDDRVFVERYVPHSRHIEIQILGDHHGTVVHLGERECSIQRRHQKIIEEAPSPVVDAEMRAAMGSAAVSLARSLGYTSAGTVEFLVDDETGEFFFLEVNTRLQVEHPVTEAVTGIDLVRQQLLVAAGEPLAFAQDDIAWSGHAVEARLYAEDADNNFLPATGTVAAFAPAAEPAVRWDSGVEAGSVVGVDFDPMLAKVIAHGPTRAEATGRLALALERLHLGGVVTNRDFLVSVLRTEAFASGDTTTDFIDRVAPSARPGPAEIEAAAVVAALWIQGRNRVADDVWGYLPSNWRNAGLPPEWVALRSRWADDPITVRYRARRDGTFAVVVGDCDPDEVPVAAAGAEAQTEVGADGEIDRGAGDAAEVHSIEVIEWRPDGIGLALDGVRRHHRIAGDEAWVHVQTDATTISFAIEPRFLLPGAELPTGGLVAPMPGVVGDVRCAVGDRVEAGQVLVVLEAMKMEHHIRAPFAGTVADVPVTVGQQVDNGALLVTIDEGNL
jgi:propionyl-CoA carboxylase alpha chain